MQFINHESYYDFSGSGEVIPDQSFQNVLSQSSSKQE